MLQKKVKTQEVGCLFPLHGKKIDTLGMKFYFHEFISEHDTSYGAEDCEHPGVRAV